MIYRQPTAEEYDLELLEARRERLANGITNDMEGDDFIDIDDDSGEEIITRGSFFKDLQKASRKIDKPKPSPKSS